MQNEQVEIVLVEDNMDDAEMTIRALSKVKAIKKLTHLKDGAEAIDFLAGTGKYIGRNISTGPRVVLLDLKMPKVDGIELLQLMKSGELTKKIPVVILTSSKEKADIEKCYAMGANSYIVKPVDFDAFMEAILQLGFYWLVHNQFSD